MSAPPLLESYVFANGLPASEPDAALCGLHEDSHGRDPLPSTKLFMPGGAARRRTNRGLEDQATVDPLPCFLQGLEYLMRHLPAEVLEEDSGACCYWHGAVHQLKSACRHFETLQTRCKLFWIPYDGWKCHKCNACHLADYNGSCVMCGADSPANRQDTSISL